MIDNGIGISPDDLDRVTEPFFQSADKRMVAAEGTGLGLTLASELVALHDGELMLESDGETGTTVNVRLPAVRLAA